MEKQEMRPLSLVSTPIADRLEENLAAQDWLACDRCGQEYRPFVLENGICDLCRKETARIEERLVEVFTWNGQRRDALIGMAQARFETTPENSRAYIAARDFDPMAQNLYLSGDPGTGKTMLACKVIHRAIRKKLSCAFRITEEWLRSLYGATGQEQQDSINRLVFARVLVFDEVGFEPSSEFSARALYEVINARMLTGRNGLVVTSNLALEKLADRLKDDRITSRIGGMCGVNVIEILGRDWRQPDEH